MRNEKQALFLQFPLILLVVLILGCGPARESATAPEPLPRPQVSSSPEVSLSATPRGNTEIPTTATLPSDTIESLGGQVASMGPSKGETPATESRGAQATATQASNTPIPVATEPPLESALAISEKPREMSPLVSKSDLSTLAGGNARFSLDFYHDLRASGNGNLFYSPYSLQSALAMTYAGAANHTAIQMASALSFDLPTEQLHPAFNALELRITAASAEGAPSEGTDNVDLPEIRIANALWGNVRNEFHSSFLDTLSANYGAGLSQLDFKDAPKQSAAAINQWVKDNTNDKIPTIVSPDGIEPETALVLTNAIYFKGKWAVEFNEDSTEDRDFHLIEGEVIKVPMMRQLGGFDYSEGRDYQAVELDYQGDELSMWVLLPAEGKFAEFEESLDPRRLASIIDGASRESVNLKLPRFKMDTRTSAVDILKGLGMIDAFIAERADFSNMADIAELRKDMKNLAITDVVHRAFIEVNEEGTEAAAATAVIVETVAYRNAGPPPPVEMTIDRPFLFFIRHSSTGAILFMGRVMNPLG